MLYYISGVLTLLSNTELFYNIRKDLNADINNIIIFDVLRCVKLLMMEFLLLDAIKIRNIIYL